MGWTDYSIGLSGVHFIVVRGVGGSGIAHTAADRCDLIEGLADEFARYAVSFICWSVLPGVMHLVVHDPARAADRIVHVALDRYVHTRGSEQTGEVSMHRLFSLPFMSFPLVDSYALLRVVRYVYRLPAALGLSLDDSGFLTSLGDYVQDEYSLAGQELETEVVCDGFSSVEQGRGEPGSASAFPARAVQNTTSNTTCNTTLVLNLLDGAPGFSDWISTMEPKDAFVGARIARATGASLYDIAALALKGESGSTPLEIGRLDPLQRKRCIRKLANAGFSCDEVVRLTGIGRTSLQLMTGIWCE